jgi:cytoskeletal protein CcmA (bactofilin family)
MANKNFVVHNGLTVGPLEINAATGDLTTEGNISLTGDLDVIGNISISGDLGVSQISKNDSSISINDTGIESTVVIAIDGATAATIDADGVKLSSGDALYVNGASVLSATTLGNGVVNSNLTSVGTLISLAVAGNLSATNLTGTLLTASQPNITAVGNLTALSASGTIRTTGQVYANSNIATSSTATGAVVVAGGVGISGGLQTGADIYIAGSIAATVDDAAALAVALG